MRCIVHCLESPSNTSNYIVKASVSGTDVALKLTTNSMSNGATTLPQLMENLPCKYALRRTVWLPMTDLY